MKKIGITAIMVATAVMLAACGDNKQPTAQPSENTQAQAPSQAELPIVKEAANNEEFYNLALQRKGFVVGGDNKNQMSNPEVIVFFDPQCPHCGTYWETTRFIDKDLKMKWIPVAILNRDSMISGSHILASENPGKTFEEHKGFLDQGVRGIPNSVASEFEAAITNNSDFFVINKATGIPFSILRKPDGTYERVPGIIPVAVLMEIFNIQDVDLNTKDNSSTESVTTPEGTAEASTTETPTSATETAVVATPEEATAVSTTETPTSATETAVVATPEGATEVSTTETPVK